LSNLDSSSQQSESLEAIAAYHKKYAALDFPSPRQPYPLGEHHHVDDVVAQILLHAAGQRQNRTLPLDDWIVEIAYPLNRRYPNEPAIELGTIDINHEPKSGLYHNLCYTIEESKLGKAVFAFVDMKEIATGPSRATEYLEALALVALLDTVLPV
jgi:hypothetical protein